MEPPSTWVCTSVGGVIYTDRKTCRAPSNSQGWMLFKESGSDSQFCGWYLVVSLAEEVVSEALGDGGAHPEDLGHVLPSDQHVPVVQLHVHVRVFVQQVVGAASRS